MLFHIAILLHPFLLFIRAGEKKHTLIGGFPVILVRCYICMSLEIVIKFVEDLSDSSSVASYAQLCHK